MSHENEDETSQDAPMENLFGEPAPAAKTGGLSAMAAGLWADLRRGAGAFRQDIARLFGKSSNPAQQAPAAYAEPEPEPEPSDLREEHTPARQPMLNRPALKRAGWSLAAGLGSTAFLVLGAGLFSAFVWMAPRVPAGADLWNVNRQAAIIVLDRNGEEIAARGARYGEAVSLEELPDYLIKAFLSTEDRRFFEHGGVDLRGTIRAAVANTRSGAVVEGGSTITQQLARNLFLSAEQTYSRKIREALLALWLEGHYSKDEILSLYLNRIYLGAGAYGIQSASLTYFGKPASDVSLAEAATLAGLPKAPSTYAPTQNPEGAWRRASDVIDNLLETGEVQPFVAHEARANPPVIVDPDTDSDLGYFFDYVAARAKEIAPLATGDLFVTTTIDQKLQRDAETAVKAALTDEAREKGAEQAALVAYDTGGALRAMVGGRSYKESQFNRATQAKRQPGSAFKPFVYVAALEAGLKPESRYVDQPVEFEGWAPKNYTDEFIGTRSLNRGDGAIDQHGRRASDGRGRAGESRRGRRPLRRA